MLLVQIPYNPIGEYNAECPFLFLEHLSPCATNHKVYDALPLRRQTYGYLPGFGS